MFREERVASGSYGDRFDDYLGFLMPRIEAAVRCLTADGSLFVHLDQQGVLFVDGHIAGAAGFHSHYR